MGWLSSQYKIRRAKRENKVLTSKQNLVGVYVVHYKTGSFYVYHLLLDRTKRRCLLSAKGNQQVRPQQIVEACYFFTYCGFNCYEFQYLLVTILSLDNWQSFLYSGTPL